MNDDRVNKLSEVLKEIKTVCEKIKLNTDKQIENTWEETDYDIKLYIAAYIFKQLEKHMYEGGSYRNLIYTKLGFSYDAYGVLQMNGAFNIHNEVSGIWMNKNKELK
jgi:hypothetical protein